jgi:iron-sulfur cluster assembly protein
MTELSLDQDGHPITLTPKAVEMAKRKVAEEMDTSIVGIRVGVRGGGCSGFAYVFDFARKIRAGRDIVMEQDGLKVVVDDRSLPYLRGATLDWEEKLIGYGFKWLNPNSKGSCGCGESFTT